MILHEYKIETAKSALSIIKSYFQTYNTKFLVTIEDYASGFINEYLYRLQKNEEYSQLCLLMQVLKTDDGLLKVRFYPSKDCMDADEPFIRTKCEELLKTIHEVMEVYSE